MQLQNTLLMAVMAAAASAAGNSTNGTDIAPVVQNRFVELELGYLKTDLLLEKVSNQREGASVDDVIAQYQATVKAEDQDLGKSQPAAPLTKPTQMILCQSFHTLTTTGLRLNNAFVNNAGEFNKTQRNEMQEAITKVNDETGSFMINVGGKALPYCLKSLQADESALSASFLDVAKALDPSEAPL